MSRLLSETGYCFPGAHADADQVQMPLMQQNLNDKWYMRPVEVYNHLLTILFHSAGCRHDHAPAPLL